MMLEKLVASSTNNYISDKQKHEFADALVTYDSAIFCCVSAKDLSSDNIIVPDVTRGIIESLRTLKDDVYNEYNVDDLLTDDHTRRFITRHFIRNIESVCADLKSNCNDVSILAGICTSRFALFILQRNAKCFVFDVNGIALDIFDEDIKDSETVYRSEFENWHFALVDTHTSPIIGVLACSNGFSSSFSCQEQEVHYLRDAIIFACKNNVKILTSYLDKSFLRLSEQSGVAVSICGFLSLDHLKNLINSLERQNKVMGVKLEINKVDRRLDALKEIDVEELKNRLSAAKEAYTQAFKDYDGAQQVFDEVFGRSGKEALFSMISSKLGNKDIVDEKTAEANLQKAELKMNKLLQEYELVKAEYDEYVARMNELRDQKLTLGKKIRHNFYYHR